jgi:DNA 3'-phosphatase
MVTTVRSPVVTNLPPLAPNAALGRLKFSEFTPPPDGKIKVAFFDADSTLRVSKSGSVSANGPTDVALLPGVAKKLAELAKEGYLITIVSNQQGVQFGHVSLNDADAALQHTIKLIKDAGGTVHGYHFAESDGPRRKPDVGMAHDLEAAAKKQFGANVSFNLGESFMVGDSAFKKPSVDKRTGEKKPGDKRPDGKDGVDFSNSDRLFAEKLGVPFHEPHTFFDWPPMAKRFENIDALVKLTSRYKDATLEKLGLTRAFVDEVLARPKAGAPSAGGTFEANERKPVDINPAAPVSPVDLMLTLDDKKKLASFVQANAPGFFDGPIAVGKEAGEYGMYSYYLLDAAAKKALVPGAKESDPVFVSWEHFDEFSLQFYQVDLKKLRAGADDAVAECASLPQASGLITTKDGEEVEDELVALAAVLKKSEPLPFQGERRKRFDEYDAELKASPVDLKELVFAPYTRGNTKIVNEWMSDAGRGVVSTKIAENAGSAGKQRFGALDDGAQGTRFFEATGLLATRVAGLADNRYFDPQTEHLIIELRTGAEPTIVTHAVKAEEVKTKPAFAFDTSEQINLFDNDNIATQALEAQGTSKADKRALLASLLKGAKELPVKDRPAFDVDAFVRG